MKAIYEVKFMVKREPSNLADTRRVAGDASTKGFEKIFAWAKDVCDDEEMVGSIAIVACEKL
jgi:hypothetical protein